jgi:hypothetical protein
MSWEPLTDHWREYQTLLEDAMAKGLFEDPADAQEVLYPKDLNMGEGEKDDLRAFVSARLNEVYHDYKERGEEFNPNLVGTYIFRAVILGMMWENERIGLR